MVDIFGDCSTGSVGPVGPRGMSGKPGIEDMCTWMPNSILNRLREDDEDCCFLLTHSVQDIKRESGKGIVKWLTRCKNKKNAVGIYPCSDIKQIPTGQWVLDFDKNLYEVKTTLTEDASNSYSFLCTTFQVGKGAKGEQFIVSNCNQDFQRGISVTNTEIRIWGAKNGTLSYVAIQLVTSAWNTVFVEYCNNKQGMYIIRSKGITIRGEFTCEELPPFTPTSIYIGGKGADIADHQFFKGFISALETYMGPVDLSQGIIFPEALKQTIISNQIIDDED